MSRQRDDVKSMLDELLDLEDGLSPWEVNFVDDVSKTDPQHWTQKQMDKIRNIYESVM